MNIPEKLTEIKTWFNTKNGKTFIIILVLIISNIASFNLGRQSKVEPQNNAKVLNLDNQDYNLADPEITKEQQYIPKSGTLAAAIMAQNEQNREEGIDNIIQQENIKNDTTSPRYVASKKGRVYYFTWCAGAKNILLENKIYFNSKEEARAVGLTPSKSCPDLD